MIRLPRSSLLILLGVVEIILLTLVGLFFYQWGKKEEKARPQSILPDQGREGAIVLEGPAKI